MLKAGRGPERRRGPRRPRLFSAVVCPILLPQNSNPSSSTISLVFPVFSKVGVSPACCTVLNLPFWSRLLLASAAPIHCGQPRFPPPPPRLPLIYFCLFSEVTFLCLLQVPFPAAFLNALSKYTLSQTGPILHGTVTGKNVPDYYLLSSSSYFLSHLYVSGNLSWLFFSVYVDIYICICASYHSISCSGHSSCLIPL